jgi:hypothetical protein
MRARAQRGTERELWRDEQSELRGRPPDQTRARLAEAEPAHLTP